MKESSLFLLKIGNFLIREEKSKLKNLFFKFVKASGGMK